MPLDDFLPLNQIAADSAASTRSALASQLQSLGVGKTGALQKSIKSRLRFQSGVVDRISYQFAKYGIFVKLGVGRGWGIKGRTSKNSKKARVAKDWLNPVLDKSVHDLADKVAEKYADITVTGINFSS